MVETRSRSKHLDNPTYQAITYPMDAPNNTSSQEYQTQFYQMTLHHNMGRYHWDHHLIIDLCLNQCHQEVRMSH